jgi:hypothetical protein
MLNDDEYPAADLDEQTGEEPHWRYVERIVALLEKALVPEAKVEHNVYLPVIGRPNRKHRQCDVVITYGEHPRQVTAIVEVQKRIEKPDINTFNGWVEKMREVGAQFLICVSALGYPDSIIDKVASQLGPTVRLLTLEDLQETKLPGLRLLPYLVYRKPQIRIESVGQVMLETPPPINDLQLNSADKVFEVSENPVRLSLENLVLDTLGGKNSQGFASQALYGPKSYSLELELVTNTELWMYLGENRLRVRNLPVKAKVEILTTKIPLTVSAYRQEFVDGALAWIASAKGIIDGKEISVELVFKPNQDRFLELTLMRLHGTEELGLIISSSAEVLDAVLANQINDNET